MQRTASSETNKVLAKNYVILAGLMRKNSEKAIISKLALVRAGFSFQYITEVENQKGQLKFGLYDLTYQFIKKNLVLIEVYPNRIEISPFVFERWRRIYRPVHEHLFLRDLSA